MSRSHTHKIVVTIPTIEDFAERFPHYGPYARGEGRPYFDLAVRPETFVDASTLTRVTCGAT